MKAMISLRYAHFAAAICIDLPPLAERIPFLLQQVTHETVEHVEMEK